MSNSPNGSEWRLCDFHFHSPKSFDCKWKAATPQDIVEMFMNHGVSMVAITDHHFIDPKLIEEMRSIAKGKITFFPGVEFRSDLGDDAVHIISLFSEQSDLEVLSTELKTLTGIYEQDLSDAMKMERSYYAHKDICDYTKRNGGLISIHAGAGRHGSIEGIGNVTLRQQALKLDLVNNAVDMLDVTKIRHEVAYKEIVFKHTSKQLGIICGSDNHDIREYAPHLKCWIKSDPTFEGLRQALCEPGDRFYLGDEPDEVKRYRTHSSRYIKRLSVARNASSPEKWFDGVALNLNPGLVSIIGNKGNGKSAVADILALACNSHVPESTFAFLNSERFKSKRNGKAKYYSAQIEWRSGAESPFKNLDDNVDKSKPELAKYIPQRYLESICNDIENKDIFQRELHSVIFSHIPKEHQHGKDTLEDLIKFKTEETLSGISKHKIEIHRINSEIDATESLLDPAFEGKIKNARTALKQMLKSVLSARPLFVKKPSPCSISTPEEIELYKSIKSDEKKLAYYTAQLKKVRNRMESYISERAMHDKLLKRISNLHEQISGDIESIKRDFAVLDVNIDDIIHFEIDTARVVKRANRLDSHIAILKKALDLDSKNSLASLHKATSNSISVSKETLSEPSRKRKIYEDDLANWKKEVRAVVGTSTSIGTIKHCTHALGSIASAREKLKPLYDERSNVSKKILDCIFSLRDTYVSLYAPVQEYAESHDALILGHQNIEFSTSVSPSLFFDKFMGFIDRSKAGPFFRAEQSSTEIEALLASCDFSSVSGSLDFCGKIVELMWGGTPYSSDKISPRQYLRKGISTVDTYDYVYSFDYLRPSYMLKWGGKPIEQLSPGERGNMLLIFYLMIDKSLTPIILDQPEDNLDNHTVYATLVPCIRDAKKRRQIIMVTHNPNLAVVCDSEQIVYTEIQKNNSNNVVIESGGIENPSINKRIIDILEGTKPAFQKRDSKYID